MLALNSELSRAAVSVPMGSVGVLFWLGLPEVLFHLLPLCAVLSLVWTGATLRESQTWMGLQLLGLGGGAFWRPVVGFSVGVGLAVGVLAHAKTGSEDAQHQRLLEAAEVVLRRIRGVVDNTEFAVENAGRSVQVRLQSGAAEMVAGDSAESLIARARAAAVIQG